jgi:hypothetical protein
MFTLHFFSFYNIVLTTCLVCINFFLFSMRMNPSGKAQLVFVNVFGNLPVPLMSKNLKMISLHGIGRLMSTFLESLILLKFSWSLMGLFCYFTWMTFRVLKEIKS